jgi:thiosulfate reductase cytochrome b subunit
MIIFVIAHVYMATMGNTVFSLIKPMITGYEDPIM